MRKGILFLTIIVFTCLMATHVSARVLSNESFVVEMNHHQAIDLQGEKDGVLEIEVKVIEGEAVDVFVMDEPNFIKYNNNQEDFEYYEKGSALNIKAKTWTFKAPQDGVYYIVVDNTDRGVAYPTSDVEVNIKISDVTTESTPFIGTIGTGISISSVAMFTILLKNRRRRHS